MDISGSPSGTFAGSVEPVDRVLSRAELQRGARYANVQVLDDEAQHLRRDVPLAWHQVIGLAIGIGALDPRSAVVGALPFPDHLVPGDAWLRVLVASNDFVVATEASTLDAEAHAVERPLLLRGDGTSTATVTFALRAPGRTGSARAWILYYYRDAMVQAQEIIATVGGTRGALDVLHRHTVSDRLDDLARIPDIPRLSLFLERQGLTDTLIARSSTGIGRGPRTTIAVATPEATLGPTVVRLRRELTFRLEDAEQQLRRGRRTGTRGGAKQTLLDDLRSLAPIGRDLHRALLAEAGNLVMSDLHRAAPRPVVQIGRANGVRFSPPWNYVYDIPLPREVATEDLPLCRLLEQWDERSPLLMDDSPDCPHRDEHRPGILCPFGFWGVSQLIEVPPSARDTTCVIPMRPGAVITTAETRESVDLNALHRHVDTISGMFRSRFGTSVLRRGSTRDAFASLIEPDQPILYFYCHGHKVRHGSPDTWLGIGKGEYVTADDISDWITSGLPDKIIWDEVRPLVVINACHPLDVVPETFLSYVDTFVRSGRALGVIGTEVKVPQDLAMRWAEAFFAGLVADQGSVGTAMKQATAEFLREGSLFGLAYTAHAWTHLSLSA